MTTAIVGGTVVTVDDDFTLHDRGWVLVDGEHIVGVGTGAAPSADTVIDAHGCAVMPGMINAHTHLFQTLFRGLGDDKSLLDWLRDYIWPAASHMTAADMHAAAMLGLAENLLSGATTVIDHQYIHADTGSSDAVLRAADQLGIRLTLAYGWADRNYHLPLVQTAQQVVERAGTLRTAWAGHRRIDIGLAPLIPWGCSDDAMSTTVAAARAWGAPLHTHCAETTVEVDMSINERGMRHVPWLASHNCLGPDVQLAHSVWLDDAELDLIASTGSVVVHAPVSNMYLASGVARVPAMRTRGISVALASDGPGSNNRQDLFEVLKTTVLLQKVHHLDPVILRPEDALIMMCRGGAAALGRSADLGRLAPGAVADVTIVDLVSPFVSPVHRVPSALVFNCSPANVRHVLVNGEVVVDGGRLVNAELAAVVATATDACRDLFARANL